MTIEDQAHTALSNVGRRKVRSALASLGVVVGTLTIVVMVSLASGVRQQINRQFTSLGLERLTVSPSSGRHGDITSRKEIITAQDVSEWKKLTGVMKVIPEVNLPNSAGMELKWNGTNQPVRLGVGNFRLDLFLQGAPEPLAGSLELSDLGGIILSEGLVQAAGISTNDLTRVIGQNVEIILHTPLGEARTFNLRVQGISQQRSAQVQVSATDRIAMKNWWYNSTNIVEREGFNSVAIRAEDMSRAAALAAQLRREGFHVESLEMFVTVANRIVGVVTVMFILIGGIALLVAALGIANTMVMAIYERTREIGILKAMGASRREIRRMFMMEAGFIGLIGGAVGLVLGWLVGIGLNQAIKVYMTHQELPVRGQFFVVTPLLAVGVILFATFIGLVAGLLPAQRAAKLDPLEALRHE